jgi:hypothetical protein
MPAHLYVKAVHSIPVEDQYLDLFLDLFLYLLFEYYRHASPEHRVPDNQTTIYRLPLHLFEHLSIMCCHAPVTDELSSQSPMGRQQISSLNTLVQNKGNGPS